jgi:hypothetical protein
MDSWSEAQPELAVDVVVVVVLEVVEVVVDATGARLTVGTDLLAGGDPELAGGELLHDAASTASASTATGTRALTFTGRS